MKRVVLFVVCACSFTFLAAQPQAMTSLRVNACPTMTGDASLVIRIEPVERTNQSTSTCEFDSRTGADVLTFYLPATQQVR
ncbi:MAG TPA: hypothetical protein VJQ50_04780 [Terriglobales bacterium]|jgi:hypothetical protein|nr:hypothetical protein [Terriglobales bacterium]